MSRENIAMQITNRDPALYDPKSNNCQRVAAGLCNAIVNFALLLQPFRNFSCPKCRSSSILRRWLIQRKVVAPAATGNRWGGNIQSNAKMIFNTAYFEIQFVLKYGVF